MGWEIGHCTCTCHTCTAKPAGLPIPMPHPMNLGEAFSNKASMKATISFVLEDPFALNNFVVGRKVNKIPSAGGCHHVKFVLTSGSPFIGIGR